MSESTSESFGRPGPTPPQPPADSPPRNESRRNFRYRGPRKGPRNGGGDDGAAPSSQDRQQSGDQGPPRPDARPPRDPNNSNHSQGGGQGSGNGPQGQQDERQRNFRDRPRTRVTRVTRSGKKKFKFRNRDRDQNQNQDRNRDNREPRGGFNNDREGGFPAQHGQEPPTGPPSTEQGLLEISGKGFGFLRRPENSFATDPQDVFVTPETVRSFGLRDGMWIKAEARMGSRGPQLTQLLDINGLKPDAYKTLPWFEELRAVNPNKRIILETTSKQFTTRVIDLMAPIGRGQRGLIVAPPRTGKTTLLQHIAEAVMTNQPKMKVIVLLVDERPEEVTELTRALPKAEIMASSNDMDVKAHCRIAQLAIERAKRLVEAGEHVFILLDSITRLARAFNNAMRGGGRTGSGGLDVRAMEIPRRLFAAARNTREAGSLTIIATALIETNSRMDDVIFQEFKGTGNMELVLDRKIAEQYIFPSVDIFKSGTRREELLLPAHQLEKIHLIRRGLSGHKPIEAIERMLSLIEKFPSNAQMLLEIRPLH
jgi:transcription termination factor Rho